MPDVNREDEFLRIKEAVLVRKPVLRDILEKHGKKTLAKYAQDFLDVNIGPGLPERQDEFLGTFRNAVARLLGEGVADSAVKQLKKAYFVSTADHHGPICDPYFINSNLVTALTLINQKDADLKNIIALSCGSISVDNDTFPRGLTFHSIANGELNLQRLAFFSSHERPSLVCLLRAYGKVELDKIKKSAFDFRKSDKITEADFAKINNVIAEVYEQDEPMKMTSYAEQITITNYKMWKKFFHHGSEGMPDLIYLELEDIVARLLVEHHLFKDTVINHFLFDEKYHNLAIRYFDGIIGAFSTNDQSGSYLFWATPKGERYRLSLKKEGNFLVSHDGAYRLELTPAAIRQALEAKEIIPGMMLDFIILSFFYGLKCLGGFSQVNYLTEMKQAYLKIMREFNYEAEIKMCETVQTKELGEDLTIAYMGNSSGKVVLATGLDLILYGDETTWDILVEEANSITLEEAVNPMFPSFYRVAYSEHERDFSLMAIQSYDITRITGLDQKVKMCIRVK